MEIKLIKDVFPVVGNSYFFHGIFQFLSLDAQVYSADDLATDYFSGNSGCKICSPLMLNLLGESSVVDSTISQHIFTLLRNRFGEKWRRLYATTTADYNPIHNYDMSEQEHRELSGEKKNVNTKDLSDTTNHGKTTDVTQTDTTTHGKTVSRDKTDTTHHGMTNTSDDYIYGFNSSAESPSNKYTSTDGGTTEVIQNETTTDGGTTTISQSGKTTEGGTTTVKNTGTDTNDGTNSELEDITRTRSGNIGVTTTQVMLQQERELWNWNFVEQMYKDIDSVLVLRIYDACRL